MELHIKQTYLNERIKEYESFVIDHLGKQNKHLPYAIKKLTQYVEDYERLFPNSKKVTIGTKKQMDIEIKKPIDMDSRYTSYDAWISENISYEDGHFINKKNLK